jgi:hypothetical protein
VFPYTVRLRRSLFDALELTRALHANGALLPMPPSLEAVIETHIDGVGRDVEDVLLAIATGP